MKPKIDINHIAHLARVNLAKDEIKNFEGQFRDILKYMEKLNKVDITKVSPTSHILPVKNVFREDQVRESLPPEKALSNAPQKKDNLFKVPKVVEGD